LKMDVTGNKQKNFVLFWFIIIQINKNSINFYKLTKCCNSNGIGWL